MDNREKFILFVNKNIGKPLQTRSISSKAKLHIRRVQSFCKSVRELSPRKVSWSNVPSKRGIVYTFKRNLSTTDVAI
jgi:hypothetical protein